MITARQFTIAKIGSQPSSPSTDELSSYKCGLDTQQRLIQPQGRTRDCHLHSKMEGSREHHADQDKTDIRQSLHVLLNTWNLKIWQKSQRETIIRQEEKEKESEFKDRNKSNGYGQNIWCICENGGRVINGSGGVKWLKCVTCMYNSSKNLFN